MTEIKEKKIRKPRAKKVIAVEPENKQVFSVENMPEELVQEVLESVPNKSSKLSYENKIYADLVAEIRREKISIYGKV